MLLVVPPGMQAIRISPTAIAGGRPSSTASA
jgi:hypothetical protein